MLRFIKDHNQKGDFAETIASKYLQAQGLKLLKKNFSCKFGEIDLIMEDHDTLVFIEVRYRKQTNYGHPLDTINYQKQKKIIKAAHYYLMQQTGYNQWPCRIDAVAIHSQTCSGQDQVQWVKNAIELWTERPNREVYHDS